MNKIPKILISPLDWGMGHATRCMPIIAYLLELNCEVIVAGTQKTNAIIKQEFQNLKFEIIPGYSIYYSSKKWQLPFVILAQIPKILNRIRSEHLWLKNYVASNQIDVVISDNRYGFYSHQVHSVFVTHQLNIQVPQCEWIQKLVNYLNVKKINRFDSCWIPDYELNNLSGDLSQNLDVRNKQFVGNLSRFEVFINNEIKFDLLILLSGPEPQRTILERKILNQISVLKLKICFVRGLPNCETQLAIPSVVVYNHLPSNELSIKIQQSKIVIARSGYSTIMDLVKLNNHAILVPTPGQTEQEYLANYLSEKKWMIECDQDDFQLEKALHDYHDFKFESYPNWNMNQYQDCMQQFIRFIFHN